MQTASEELFKLTLEYDGPLPTGVLPIPYQLNEADFWPGGMGHDPSTEFPHGGIMCLGHNYGILSDWQDTRRTGLDIFKTNTTCRETLNLFKRMGVDSSEIFLTNFFAHLMDSKSSIGQFPGLGDKKYEDWTRSIFIKQVTQMQPRAIFVLGMHIPPLLASMSPSLSPWARNRTLPELDAADAALIPEVTLNGHTFAAAVLTHPSFRHINVKRRRYKGLEGEKAEEQMIYDALHKTA
ncbi:hypothetical protein [Comamonas jiangduensis]|uniref:hypothetical protein n=1 Tax=Comamonas jiangduensis TaxID=1194168 RepID=UPI003BF7BAF5